MSIDGEPMQEQPLSLKDLCEAALREDWDTVDTSLSAAGNEEYQAWATNSGLEDKDPNLRDLAVSILERSSQPLEAGIVDKLTTLMKTDENPYVRFRSAFALCGHDLRSDEVEAVRLAAESDPDVADIARAYALQ